MQRIHLHSDDLPGIIRTACILEAAAGKAGNVHPSASFEDVDFADFLRAAEITAPLLAGAAHRGVGPAILDAVSATIGELGTNPNLGIILLLAPLASIPERENCAQGIGPRLAALTMADAEAIFAAIRLAHPGGLGKVTNQDVSAPPTVSIRESMRLAADRDLVARQYTNDFHDVLGFGRQAFLDWQRRHSDWETSIVGTHLSLLAEYGDSLIARKCGAAISAEARVRSGDVLTCGWPIDTSARDRFRDLDHWLRGDGNRRNPGTTADLIAAILFAVIRDRAWTPPAIIELAEND